MTRAKKTAAGVTESASSGMVEKPPRPSWLTWPPQFLLSRSVLDVLQHNWRWMGGCATAASFVIDFLQPLARIALYALWVAVVAAVILIALVGAKRTLARVLAAPLAFVMVMIAAFGLTVLLQQSGDGDAGFLGTRFPKVKTLQERFTALVEATERVEDKIETGNRKLDDLVLLMTAKNGVPVAVLQTILEGFGDRVNKLDLPTIRTKLEAKVKEFQTLQKTLDDLTGNDAVSRRFREEIKKLIAAGAFKRADAKLSMLEDHTAAILKKMESTARDRRIALASDRARRGDLAALQFRYRVAAKHLEIAARIAAPASKERQWRYTMSQGDMMLAEGTDFGDLKMLRAAADVYERARSYTIKKDLPRAWARSSSRFGIALRRLGERLQSLPALRDAVEAQLQALAVLDRKNDRPQWFETQWALAATQFAMGELTRKAADYKKALKIYDQVSDTYKKSEDRQRWAEVQSERGNVLLRLGELPDGESYLADAVVAYGSALTVQSPNKSIQTWANTKNSLGAALYAIARNEAGTETLKEALAAYSGALQGRPRNRYPLKWAATRKNMGLALFLLSERLRNSKLLEQSIAAYQDAVSETTRARSPGAWASLQKGIGDRYRRLGDVRRDPAPLYRAIAAYRNAQKERTLARAPIGWAQIQARIALCLWGIGDLTGDVPKLQAARASFVSALKVFRKHKQKKDIAIAEKDIASLDKRIAERKKP